MSAAQRNIPPEYTSTIFSFHFQQGIHLLTEPLDFLKRLPQLIAQAYFGMQRAEHDGNF